MTRYKAIQFNRSVYHPARTSRSEKVELIIANEFVSITRDGDVVTIQDAKSGRCVDLPWSGVRFADRDMSTDTSEFPVSKRKVA